MRFSIIGCGLIGRKRLGALPAGCTLAIACDENISRAEEIAVLAKSGDATSDYRQAVNDSKVNAVIVATHNAALSEIAGAAIAAGKHVLIEKPAATSVAQIDELIRLARTKGVCVRIGFNHRYHPAFLKAREIVDQGTIGELMFVRARYGHGGRVGYENEWRADQKLSGGGELMDQGVHLIDLAGWFLGSFEKIEGHATTLFWNMRVDDNAFLSLRTKRGQIAWLHASCTEWKNLFSFEIYGRQGKLHIDGLGGSYGIERLSYYQMLPEMGPPETTIWEFPRGDNSWQLELAEFVTDIVEHRVSNPGLSEAKAALQVVQTIYNLSDGIGKE